MGYYLINCLHCDVLHYYTLSTDHKHGDVIILVCPSCEKSFWFAFGSEQLCS